jgi:tetratricopeptide (TPR) repeat protein
MIPYIYLPTSEELTGSAMGIGRTAAQLLQFDQPREAAKLAALAVRLNPQDERLWSVLAEAQLRNEQLDQASVSLARAKNLNPKKPGLWFAEAAIALRAERPDEAIPLIDRGLELDPDNHAAYFDLGNARIMRDELPMALKSFEKATALKNDFWEALNNQALVLFEMGNRDEAIRRWRRVLKIKSNAEPMLALAAALYQRNKSSNSEILTLARDALASDPNYVLAPHQEEQLWGYRIRQATAKLLTEPELAASVERAQANATWKKRR